MAFTKEEYEQMKIIIQKLAEMDAERHFMLEEATRRWMEEACELYSALSRKMRGKTISYEELEHELHDTLWGLTGLCRLVLDMKEAEKAI
jgi:NTP pyrophosphatase (non-canonical NTP hydrolase)